MATAADKRVQGSRAPDHWIMPTLRLLRWMGPWADPEASPRRVQRRGIERATGSRRVRLLVYTPEPGRIRGSVVFAHGVNPRGPCDPRADRFMRVLAGAGFLVAAPFLPPFIDFDLQPGVQAHLEAGIAAATALPEHPPGTRPGVFSISFGCLPALAVASDPRTAQSISGVVVYGGYADPHASLAYAIGAPGARPPGSPPLDRLLLPGLALALTLGDGPEAPGLLEPARAGWRRYVEATWGVAEMRTPDRYLAVAEHIARELPETARALFRRGAGLDAHEPLFRQLLERRSLEPLDIRAALAGVRCPVRLMHGAGDPVIPHTQIEVIRRALPETLDVRSYRTGLFDHTQVRSLGDWLQAGPALVREVRVLLGMARAIVELGLRR